MPYVVPEYQLSKDVLRGAGAIAEFLYGAKNRKRKVYYLTERNSLPVFRVGSMLCARKSTLTDWIVGMEGCHSAKLGGPGAQNVSEVL
jgi:hypothetical protein